MKKLTQVFLILILAAMTGNFSAGVISAQNLTSDKDTLKKLSTFLSNFTELGFMNFDVYSEGSDDLLHLGAPDAYPDLIRFGINHNYLNNFQSRIKNCPDHKCEHGSLIIDGRFVAESVKKYFDLNLKNQSVLNSDPPYYYDGQVYYFHGSDGESVYYADVLEMSREGNLIRLKGELYEAIDKKNRPAVFEATVKPYSFDGVDSFTVVSIDTKWLDLEDSAE
jgi:hypothetical protein